MKSLKPFIPRETQGMAECSQGIHGEHQAVPGESRGITKKPVEQWTDEDWDYFSKVGWVWVRNDQS